MRRRHFLVVALIALVVLVVAANVPIASGGRVTITGHLVPRLRLAHQTRETDGTRILTLSIALSLRNAAQLKELIAAQNDPHATLYHQFLTPTQFKQQFDPTQATVDVISTYLRGQGLTVTSISTNNILIDAT